MSKHSRPRPQSVSTGAAARPTRRSETVRGRNSGGTTRVKRTRRDRRGRRNRETRQSSVDLFKEAKRSVWASRLLSIAVIIFVVAISVAIFFVTKDYIDGERKKMYKDGFSHALEIGETKFPNGDVEGLLKTSPDSVFEQAKEFPGSGIPGNSSLKSSRVTGIQVPSGTVSSSYAEVGMCINVPGSGKAPFVVVASTANYKIESPEWTVGSVSAGGRACQATGK